MAAPQTVTPEYAPHARAERLIALGRFILAASSLLAVYLEPSTPARYQEQTYTILVVYTIYAAAMVILAWRRPIPAPRWRLVSHVADLVLFSIFIYLTEGPASPFFLYFVFSLFCATLRFSWRGILMTAVAAIVIFGGISVAAVLLGSHAEWSRVAIREAYLAVTSALLVYLGVYQHHLRRELASLAAWPRERGENLQEEIGVALRHAASLLHSERLLLLWEEPEEPWAYAAFWTGGITRVDRFPAHVVEAPSPAPPNVSFFVRDSGALLFDAAEATSREAELDPIGAIVRERYQLASAIGVSLESENVSLRLFAAARHATVDDLVLVHVVGRLLLATVEQSLFVQQVRHVAGTEERLRISRELHDGIIQSLGGVGLQLQSIRTQLKSEATVDQRLAQVQAVIEHDQRELRTLVQALRPDDRSADSRQAIVEQLERLKERFLLEWGVNVTVEVNVPDQVPPRFVHEVQRIVNEALANAARHGRATAVDVGVHGDERAIRVRVKDNGGGFRFKGRYDLASLEMWGAGPKTLRERISNLGGSLVIESNERGATIEAALPLPRAGALA